MKWTKEELKRKSLKSLKVATVVYVIAHITWVLTEGGYIGNGERSLSSIKAHFLHDVTLLGISAFVPTFILVFIFPEIRKSTKWLHYYLTDKYFKRSSISKLKEYKELLDKGIITKEEYIKVSEPLKKKVI